MGLRLFFAMRGALPFPKLIQFCDGDESELDRPYCRAMPTINRPFSQEAGQLIDMNYGGGARANVVPV
jgi:hypothetical protein